MYRKIIIFPIEIKSRDLLPRLQIASEFIKNGYQVIIGEQGAIHNNIESLPVGILFEKSLGRIKEKRFKKFIKLGHKICSLDEEGLSSIGNKHNYSRSRFTENNLRLASKIFVWGNFEKKEIIKKFSKFKDKIIVSGHNKISLWHENNEIFYKDEIRYIKKFQNYILISSNVGSYIHRENIDTIKNTWKKAGLRGNRSDILRSDNYIKFSQFKFYKFKKMIEKLSKEFYEQKIILRPHPSENIKKWKHALSHLKNVFVIYKYDIGPWIMRSNVFIHSGCTTGLEAFFRRKFSISYLPQLKSIKFKNYQKHLSNKFSLTLDSNSKIVKQIKKGRVNLKKYPKEIKLFPKYKNCFAIKKIFKEINKIKIDKKKIYEKKNFFLKNYFLDFRNWLENLFNKNLKEKFYFKKEMKKIIYFLNDEKVNINAIKKNIFIIEND